MMFYSQESLSSGQRPKFSGSRCLIDSRIFSEESFYISRKEPQNSGNIFTQAEFIAMKTVVKHSENTVTHVEESLGCAFTIITSASLRMGNGMRKLLMIDPIPNDVETSAEVGTGGSVQVDQHQQNRSGSGRCNCTFSEVCGWKSDPSLEDDEDLDFSALQLTFDGNETAPRK